MNMNESSNHATESEESSLPRRGATSENIPEKSSAIDLSSSASSAPQTATTTTYTLPDPPQPPPPPQQQQSPAPLVLAKTIADMTHLSTYQRGQLLHWKELLVHISPQSSSDADLVYAENVRRHKQEREYRFDKRAVIRRLYRMAGCEPPSARTTTTTTTSPIPQLPAAAVAAAVLVKRQKHSAAAEEDPEDDIPNGTATANYCKQLKTNNNLTTARVSSEPYCGQPRNEQQQQQQQLEPLKQPTTLKYMPIEKILPPTSES
jgi:hypothetical protein